MSQLPIHWDSPSQPPRRRTAALSSFHARNETPAEALEGEERARAQQDEILSLMRAIDPARWTPSELQVAFPHFQLTSIRRALTNLSTETEEQPNPPLRKHPEDRRPSPRGGRECCWSLR